MYFFFCMGATDTVMGWFSGSAAVPVVGVAVAAVSVVDFEWLHCLLLCYQIQSPSLPLEGAEQCLIALGKRGLCPSMLQ